ncbi:MULTISPECIES: phosphoglycerate dehydrogenase [Paenibacillus]|jgi:D-3-phosphoglycerate dehydrogenase|uniref:D-3-phosphoglycerate dehydrogenase n=3 Tax=Paenibacillus TaxID=44249 RepID=A0A1R1EV08_9BACL|nr:MULTISPECIES: phosphoglycerate dehydrogenase [Paenibacillus]MBB3127625.1 D-3-phosphoglycerate dehydrogenase [Paenibacillus rhizosphaerae]MEC0176450.1 phosphoglycerate dehydrogenase [Paenibacillus favisporus]OMF55676.1 phosphoglycerate dehydrogenase [Paenibacillus rhizosphaerae]PQP87860.1 phosphoglycerate dehydrogenase [Paenibacillus sp. AR247]UYO01756.1 phosphoglycerate dehydrogenase [Paenibacillus sp. PSB04]
MFKVLVSDPISDLGIQQLVDAPDVTVEKNTGLSEDELAAIIGDYDALLVRSQTRVTEKIMAAGTRLKVVGRAGVGVDNIDLEAATQRGIIVINAPDGNTITTCEHTFAMMMALARHIPQAYAKTIGGTWDRKSFLGVELRNKTLGVLGMGRIGSEVAKRAKAFGMNILAFDPFLTQERAEKLEVKLATVDDIIRNADFMTVHTPLTPETRHMISRPQFEVMKKGMRIINCARGGVIDEMALVEAIDEGIVAGAAFDVFESEPPQQDHPFLNHPKIIVTPHLGASTIEAQENVAIDVSEEVLHILRDEPFKNAVNMPPVAPSIMSRLQPYFSLGEKLGSFAAQITKNQAIHEIHVDYAGDLSDIDTLPLTRYIVKGVLAHHLGSEVNIVNCMHLAKNREVNVAVSTAPKSKGFTNLLTVTLKTSENEERLVAGTLLNGYGERIVQLNKFPVDIAPEGHQILISHNDKPGIIGQVGTLLGKNDVNIASMQVGRKIIGGEAIMILTVDKGVQKEVLNELTTIPELNSAVEIVLS